MIKIIRLTDMTTEVTVDEKDFNFLSAYRWRTSSSGYARSSINKEEVFMHRLIMNAKKGDSFVDHINGKKLDNRRCNLRFCSQRLNTCNRPKQWNNKTGYKGVATSRNPAKFRALIQVKGKQIYLGTFDSTIQAAIAYDEAARIHFGEFAYLNFPNINEAA